MSNFTFRPAVRQQIPLIIGLAGGTGSGKTFSALMLAKGLAGGKRFALIDTEAGRALHYADQFDFDHGVLGAPFEPDRYSEAIAAADDANYPVIVVDSMSHEWAGDGGVLDMQEAEFERLGNREENRMRSWVKPKLAHKRFVTRLLQQRAHLVLCFRAEPKVDMVRENGRTVVVDKKGAGGFEGWLPITEKTFPYEMTLSVLLMAETPGVPKPIKVEAQHRAFFPTDRPISEQAGQQLAAWAAGGAAPARAKAPEEPPERQQRPRAEKVDPRDAAFDAEFGRPAFDLGRFKSLYEGMEMTIADFRGELGIGEGARTKEVQRACEGWWLAHKDDAPVAGDAELSLVTRVKELQAALPVED